MAIMGEEGSMSGEPWGKGDERFLLGRHSNVSLVDLVVDRLVRFHVMHVMLRQDDIELGIPWKEVDRLVGHETQQGDELGWDTGM